MFCSKCGNKVKDDAKFCCKCGAKIEKSALTSALLDLKKIVETQLNAPSQTETQYDKSAYEMFEEFYYKPLLGAKKCFAITDRSIIYENKEYPLSQLTVIDIPKGEFVLYQPKTMTLDGKEIEFWIEPQQEYRERFMSVALRTNQKIKLNSIKDKLIYVNTLWNCRENFSSHQYSPTGKPINNRSISFCIRFMSDKEQETAYPEIKEYCYAINKKQSEGLPEYEQKILQEMMFAQELLNNFYAETPILSKENRICNTKVLIEHLNENDVDANAAAVRYFEKVEEERELENLRAQMRREENEERRAMGIEEEPSSSGSGFLSNMLSTAAGVAIGNKMSGVGSNKPKKTFYKYYYICSSSCPYSSYSTNSRRCTKEPSTCGRGVKCVR